MIWGINITAYVLFKKICIYLGEVRRWVGEKGFTEYVLKAERMPQIVKRIKNDL